MHEYDILLKATIEIGGRFKANTRREAEDLALRELRPNGEISNLDFERSVLLDEVETV